MPKRFIKHVRARTVNEVKDNVICLGAALGQRLSGDNVALFIILKVKQG